MVSLELRCDRRTGAGTGAGDILTFLRMLEYPARGARSGGPAASAIWESRHGRSSGFRRLAVGLCVPAMAGGARFVARPEARAGRVLRARKVGRPKKPKPPKKARREQNDGKR